MLGADGEADRVLPDSLIEQFFLGQLGMGRAGGMNDEALHIGDVCQQGENFQRIDEGPGFLLAALDFKGEDGTAAVREILLIEYVIRMIRDRRVIDFFHQRMIPQEVNHLFGIFRVPVQP